MTETQESRQLPAWLNILIIIVCIGAGGAFVWWYIRTPVPRGTVVLGDAPARQAAIARPQSGITQIVNTPEVSAWRARGGNVVMEIRQPKTGDATYEFRYMRASFLTPEQLDLRTIFLRVVSDPSVAKYIEATPEQMAKLEPLPRMVLVQMDDADRNRLLELWKSYNTTTDKSAAEKPLTSALEEIGNKSLDASKQAAAQQCDLVKQTLTADQIKKFHDMGKPGT
jgi:hypothetical protein